MKFKYKILEFSQNQGRGPDRKPRRPRSDRGRRRSTSTRDKIKDTARTAGTAGLAGAGYVGSLVAGDQIFTGANKAASRLGRNTKASAIKTARASGARGLAKRLAAKAPAGSARGRLGTAAKYAAGLAIGDLAIRGASRAIGRTIENRHKLSERAKKVRKRIRK